MYLGLSLSKSRQTLSFSLSYSVINDNTVLCHDVHQYNQFVQFVAKGLHIFYFNCIILMHYSLLSKPDMVRIPPRCSRDRHLAPLVSKLEKM